MVFRMIDHPHRDRVEDVMKDMLQLFDQNGFA